MRRALLFVFLLLLGAARADDFVNQGLARIQKARLALDQQEIVGEESIRNSLDAARENLEQIAVRKADTLALTALLQSRQIYTNRADALEQENARLELRTELNTQGRELVGLERDQVALALREIEEDQAGDQAALDRLMQETIQQDLSQVAQPDFPLLKAEDADKFSLYTYRELLEARRQLLRKQLEARAQVRDATLRISVLLERREQIYEAIASEVQRTRLSLAERIRLDQDSLHALQRRQPYVHADSLELLLLLTEEIAFQLKVNQRDRDVSAWRQELEGLGKKLEADSSRAVELRRLREKTLLPAVPGAMPDDSLDHATVQVQLHLVKVGKLHADLERRADENRRDIDLATGAVELWSGRLTQASAAASGGLASDSLSFAKFRRHLGAIKDKRLASRSLVDELEARHGKDAPEVAQEKARGARLKAVEASARQVWNRVETRLIPRSRDQFPTQREVLEQIHKASSRRVLNARERLDLIAGWRSELEELREKLATRLAGLELQKRRKTALWLRQVQPFEGDLTGAWDTLTVRLQTGGRQVIDSGTRSLWWLAALVACSVGAVFLQRRFRILRRDLVG